MTYLERLKKLNIHQGSTDKIDKSTSVSFGSPGLAGFWPCDVERHLRFSFPDPHSGTLFAWLGTPGLSIPPPAGFGWMGGRNWRG